MGNSYKKAPQFDKEGRHLTYQEVFKSPFPRETEQEAREVLETIRDFHPAYDGWVEIEAWVEQLPNGLFRAVRNHARYVK